MQTDEEEYIAYRPDKYTQIENNPQIEEEDEFAYEKALHSFKWNEFMNEYNSLAASDISFKRVKRQDEPPPEEPPPPPPADAAPPADGGDGGAGGDGGGDAGTGGNKTAAGSRELKRFMTPVIALTAIFAAIFIFGPLLVRKGPNRGVVQCSIMLSAFCMWIFWVTVYIGQMNPLMGPRLENTTVAWMSVKVGNAIKPLVPPAPPPPAGAPAEAPPAEAPPPPPPAEEPPPPPAE